MPELAKAAAALIRKRGWTQNKFQGADGSVCMLGAIRITCQGNTDLPKEGTPCAAIIQDLSNAIYNKTKCGVTEYNDYHARTEAEVLGVLELIGAQTG